MRALLITNPTSGQGRAERTMPVIERELREFADDLQAYVTTGPGDATGAARQAVEDDLDLVVVAAGDGTVREVIDGVAGSEVPMAIIPMGTGNVLARELRLPLDSWRPTGLQKTLEIIRAGHIRTVDIGRANGKLFVLMAGAGFDAAIVAGVKPFWKDRLGSWAYVFTILKTLAPARPARLVVESPTERFEGEAWAVVVGNAASYAWKLHLAPSAEMDDGLLNVVIFKAVGRLRFVSLMVQAIWAGHVSSPHVVHFTTPAVKIEADPPQPVQLDGDLAGETPVSIQLIPQALRLIVPPTSRE